MEFNIFLGVAALVIAAVLTWCILRFFFAPRRGGARATLHDGVQQATITVRGGYSPDIVTMQAGIPITLRFDRKETGECTSHVVFPDLGTDTMLPGNETTEMSLPPLPAGDSTYSLFSEMLIYAGRIILPQLISSSSLCALQPVIRAVAKSGV